jgi:hypothetical protein
MRPTLVAIHHLDIDGRLFHHNSEIVPGLLAKEAADKLLDEKRLIESKRRSLYRLFPKFSDCKESEHLNNEEQAAYGLPD